MRRIRWWFSSLINHIIRVILWSAQMSERSEKMPVTKLMSSSVLFCPTIGAADILFEDKSSKSSFETRAKDQLKHKQKLINYDQICSWFICWPSITPLAASSLNQLLLFSVLYDHELNIFGVLGRRPDKTSNLQTPLWALGTSGGHFPLVVWQKGQLTQSWQ